MKVPFLDLARDNEPYLNEFTEQFKEVILTSSFVGGEAVSGFESDFAKYCSANYCAGVSSGTSAINLALEAAGIGKGDEVIVPANTFIATAAAVVHAGAKPIFCDVNPETHNIDPEKAKAAITSRTKAIIGVHLYGRLCDVVSLQKICIDHKIDFYEDAAQAHGAVFNNQRAGAFGRAAFFSFYPGKNLGSLGEGGAIVTNDQKLHERIKYLREHGSPVKYQHEMIGYNHRLHAMQARFLRIKLRDLDQKNILRKKVATAYYEGLVGLSDQLALPTPSMEGDNVFHLFPVFTKHNAELAKHLLERGVQSGFHYPKPCHLQNAFVNHGHKIGDFPVAEKSSAEQLSLPMFPQMSKAEVDHVISSVREFFK